MRGWGLPPADATAAAECGARDFFAPDVAALAAATGGVSLPATEDRCAAVDCGRHGNCLDGRCVCSVVQGKEVAVGPRCSVAAPVPPSAPRRAAVVVSPSGVDAEGCGSTRAPCASVRHALLVHFWEWAQRAEGEAAAEVVLLRGRYAGAANTALELHGVPLVLRGLDGASEQTEIDCTPRPTSRGSPHTAAPHSTPRGPPPAPGRPQPKAARSPSPPPAPVASLEPPTSATPQQPPAATPRLPTLD